MFGQALQIFKPLWQRRLVFGLDEILCQTNEIKPNKHRRKRAFYAPIFLIILNHF